MHDTTESSITQSLERFKRRSVGSIGTDLGREKPVTSRTVWALSKNMLNLCDGFDEYSETVTPQVRSVILSPKDKPTQSMSFASFDYNAILDETWEESAFYHQLTSRFLFMRYRTLDDGTIVFDGVKFWSMPQEDIQAARSVWQKTADQIRIGQAHSLPTMGESSVAHVRPRAANAADRTAAPDGTLLTKKCFWLKASYIAKHIF